MESAPLPRLRWTNAPFVRGARKMDDIPLSQLPYQERLADMPLNDLEAEGNLWASREQFTNLFGGPDLVVGVVRFELVNEIASFKWLILWS